MVVDDVVTLDGELVDLRQAAAEKKKKKEQAKKDKLERAARKERQAFYSAMIWIGQQKGLKDGWSSVQYREKYGEWPNGLKKVARKPSPEVIAENKAKYKAYVDAKKAAQKAPEQEFEYQGEW